MRLRCATHDVEFSEPAGRGFHEALNAGCRWKEVSEPGHGGNKLWAALAVGVAWLVLTIILGLLFR